MLQTKPSQTKAMKIKVLSTGYYDSTNNKVALLKEGEELDVVGETGPVKLVDYKVNCWQCLKNGRYVFVEKENAEVINFADWRVGSDGRLYRH